jgi:hypothetical protein
MPADRRTSGRKANRTSWRKGVSGNPKGAPKRGESWAETVKAIGDLTPSELAAKCTTFALQVAPLGDGLTMREAVVIRTFVALLNEPTGGLLSALMSRAEGLPRQQIELDFDWRLEAAKHGLDVPAVFADMQRVIERHWNAREEQE